MKQRILKKKPDEPARAVDSTARRQISMAAGTEAFYNRDPVYHVSETFQKTFDARGSEMAGELFRHKEKSAKDAALEPKGVSPLTQTSMDDCFQRSETDPFLDKFSQIAFNRGTLASAILEGTGQMMLFTCMKRTIAQFQPRSERQRKLFPGSVRKNTEGAPNRLMFNRATTDGAVGMVADVTRDARRLVETLTDTAEGKNVLPRDSGTNTLNRVYPFLSDEREQTLIKQYKARISELAGDNSAEAERAVLDRALKKAGALAERKRYMKAQFIFNLRQMGDNAQGMSALFSSEDFLEALNRAVNVRPAEAKPAEPDDSPDGGKVKKSGVKTPDETGGGGSGE